MSVRTVEKPARMHAWSGYYVQNGTRHQMRFHHFAAIEGGGVFGDGTDVVGDFQIEGNVQSDGQLRFIKQYIGQHSVIYTGKLDGKTIDGTWELPGNVVDDFHIEEEPFVEEQAPPSQANNPSKRSLILSQQVHVVELQAAASQGTKSKGGQVKSRIENQPLLDQEEQTSNNPFATSTKTYTTTTVTYSYGYFELLVSVGLAAVPILTNGLALYLFHDLLLITIIDVLVMYTCF